MGRRFRLRDSQSEKKQLRLCKQQIITMLYHGHGGWSNLFPIVCR